jgi:hypothetical protein
MIDNFRESFSAGGRKRKDPALADTQSAATVSASVDCRSAPELFRFARENALPTCVAEGLRQHLSVCPACTELFRQQAGMYALLDQTFQKQNISDAFTVQTGQRLNQRRQVMQAHPTTSSEALSAVHFNGTNAETGETGFFPEEEGDEESENQGFFGALANQFGAAPWWVTSGVFHGLLILLIYFIGEIILTVNSDDKIITTTLDERQEIEPEKKQVQRDLIDKIVPETENMQVIEDPVVTHEQVQEADHHETDDNMSDNAARGDEDCISDVPLGGKGTVAAIGVGGGRGGAFGHRGAGGRQHLLRKGGGGADTENAVNSALAWLARHQEPDGRWDTKRHEGAQNVDCGITGLALLAFLGAGHTEKVGKYRDNVRRAVAWIITQQEADGSIGKNFKEYWHPGYAYHHAICGLALAEAAGMAKVPATVEAAKKAVIYTTDIHQGGSDSQKAAWRYNPKQAADSSVSGWFVMQLKSARVSGLPVDPASFEGALAFYDSIENKKEVDGYSGGRFPYQKGGKDALNTSAIGILCNLFCGRRPGELMAGAEYLSQNLPVWDAKLGVGGVGGGGKSFPMYYAYYGTLAMFQINVHWNEWNKALKQMLLPKQRKGGPLDGSAQDVDGSWDLIGGADDQMAGRVYMTALGALCLEVYYRYLPITR